ncbi:SanA/YdcF family protein [Streptomyces sp. SDT5-1]|uniref:SanA/YdcF family protein n=1 Tax=Streptomyces sp. SDT5-1 TaxID=3406418 RepID=UPI003FD195B2
MAVCTVALVPSTWLHVRDGEPVRSVGDVPRSDVGVVFGAGLWDGEPSPYLAHRLDTAAELYRTGKVRVLLVTGDNSREEYDEPDAMRTYLTRHGVPSKAIVGDYAGFDTWDSCVRAKKIFGVDRAVLVTQDFHARRALALCEAAGITSYAVGVTEPHDVTWYAGGARELFAATKAALDVTLRPDPHFLGPREPGVHEALGGTSRWP